MKIAKMKKYAIMIIMLCVLCSVFPKHINAASRATDIVNKNHSRTFSHTKSMLSIYPDVDTTGFKHKTVSFNVTLNGALQYDRVTGKYVSASTPTISIGYSLPANFSLQLFNVSTSKYDGGNYITFSYKADVKGLYDGGITYTVDYGRISGSFQVKK